MNPIKDKAVCSKTHTKNFNTTSSKGKVEFCLENAIKKAVLYTRVHWSLTIVYAPNIPNAFQLCLQVKHFWFHPIVMRLSLKRAW